MPVCPLIRDGNVLDIAVITPISTGVLSQFGRTRPEGGSDSKALSK